jgi:hypothetical protein
MNIQHVNIAHGWHWVARGFGLFRRSPVVWILFVMMLYLAAQIAVRVPLVGMLLMLCYPLILAGLMLGCRDVEQGKPLELGHIAAGFRRNAGQLVAIGGANLLGQMLIGMVLYATGGPELRSMLAGEAGHLDPAAVADAANQILIALVGATLLSIPLLMAVWFAPLIVAFHGRPALEAMKYSFLACWRNLIPFFAYGLLLFGLIVLAMLPFGLAHPQINPGAWVVLPFVLPSIYAAYRDLFRDYA